VAIGVNTNGNREVLGLDVVTGEDGAGWLACLRSIVAPGLTRVQLVISDCHAGLPPRHSSETRQRAHQGFFGRLWQALRRSWRLGARARDVRNGWTSRHPNGAPPHPG
jgi:hypothetical protein